MAMLRTTAIMEVGVLAMYYDYAWEKAHNSREGDDAEKEVLYIGLGHALTVECSVV